MHQLHCDIRARSVIYVANLMAEGGLECHWAWMSQVPVNLRNQKVVHLLQYSTSNVPVSTHLHLTVPNRHPIFSHQDLYIHLSPP